MITFQQLECACKWVGEKMAGYGYPCCHPQQRVPDIDSEECCVHCDEKQCPVLQGKGTDELPPVPKGEIGNHWQHGDGLLCSTLGFGRESFKEIYQNQYHRGYQNGYNDGRNGKKYAWDENGNYVGEKDGYWK